MIMVGPWTSTFCRKVKESASWGWGEEADAKCYRLLAMLVNHCSQDAEIDFSLTWINSLNLGESGAYGFYEEIKQLDSLIYLATDRNFPDLASKCPKLEHLDFRRCREKLIFPPLPIVDVYKSSISMGKKRLIFPNCLPWQPFEDWICVPAGIWKLFPICLICPGSKNLSLLGVENWLIWEISHAFPSFVGLG